MKPFSSDSPSGVVVLADCRLRRQPVVLVVLSLGFGLFVMAFLAGLGAMEYGATDTAGRTRIVDLGCSRTSDRESFIDVPIVPIMAGGVWLCVVAVIAWRQHRFWRRSSQPILIGEARDAAMPARF